MLLSPNDPRRSLFLTVPALTGPMILKKSAKNLLAAIRRSDGGRRRHSRRPWRLSLIRAAAPLRQHHHRRRSGANVGRAIVMSWTACKFSRLQRERPGLPTASEAPQGKLCLAWDEHLCVLHCDTSPTIALTLIRFTFTCTGQERSRDHLPAHGCPSPSSTVHSPTSNAFLTSSQLMW